MRRIVIAEIGINHDGEMTKARELIRDAAESGCDGVKFQYRNLLRAYSGEIKEIGDEILYAEIEKTYLDSNKISELAVYARSLKLSVGTSFFTTEDLADFSHLQDSFDFFKIPSAELMNLPLIKSLLSTAKPVYLSVGMHTESEIESVFGQLADFNNWFPMHCVSNYPVVNHNSALGYIKYLAQKWDRPVGFSSHDDFWENNVIALTFGATIFERHITKNRADSGLDHSTSSTPDEFKKLCKIIKDFDLITTGNGPRVPNQGELLNKQNLGRSFYANSNLPTGTLIKSEDFSYRSPMTGLAIAEFQETLGERLRFGMNEGDVLTRSHLVDRDIHLSNKQLSEMHRLNVSLPVRLSDYEKVRSQIPVKGFEFHLSYQEVASDLSKFRVHSEDSFSIHLPDYINSNSLINPFSEDREVKHTSITCIERVGDFGRELAKLTEKKIPIVASLSAPMMSREDFYSQVRKLFDIYSSDGVEFTLQWLPPIAWYFGGSVRLEMVNELIDVQFLKENGIPITMDISHLILGRNAFGFDPIEVMESLRGQISHIHLSDAIGIDGEGLQFGDGGLQNERLIKYALTYKQLKVLEVWQGHLEGFFGFKEAIQRLADEKYSIL